MTQDARGKLYRTEAIVLKRIDVGEADKIVTLYTPGLGKMRAMAKGVRKTTSRLGGNLELFNHSALHLARGRNLDIITESQTRHPYKNLREGLDTIAQALYAAELLDRFTEEGIENYPVWELLVETLNFLDTGKDPRTVIRAYELYLLGYLGYRPQLQHCLGCEEVIQPTTNYFSAAQGGILCPRCNGVDRSARQIGVEALKIFRHLQRENLSAIPRLRLSEVVLQEMEAHMRAYINYILERELKSAQFIHTLSRMAVPTATSPLDL